MNTTALKQIELVQELFRIPKRKLGKVLRYIDSIQIKAKPKQRKSLSGIWKDKGFEQISSLEIEVREIRREIQSTILKKKI